MNQQPAPCLLGQCPGCARTPTNVEVNIGLGFYVACRCGWCGPVRSRPGPACKAWNTRTVDQVSAPEKPAVQP
jgi:hypothetical protein